MARQRSRAAPSQQTRKASTMPTRQTPPPPPAHAAPQQQHNQMAPGQQQPSVMGHPAPRQPGLFGQMASTAAGVAVGSAVGHTIGYGISSMFGGGSSAQAEATEAQQPQQYQQPNYYGNAAIPTSSTSCDANAKAFTQCLEANGNDVSRCQFYLEQLKACQAFVAQQQI
ncbi:Coiled-coil-helix-coiled-coil-helix domain-containing protein 2 [Mortierella sp. AD011]|nr:Coiled-coil-helix-coiled-coil-helix domain-containing protein 2 [Mortierella sp. AD010]KAF9392932.1 Coiled-coil-helix-coiled-coil-helix domain-containing protein 2 [Mortierella sp. AD011]